MRNECHDTDTGTFAGRRSRFAGAGRQGRDIAEKAHDLLRSSLGIPEEAFVTEAKHAVLIQRLQAAGLLTQLPTHPGQTLPFQPITVSGPPVSQTLVEDREPWQQIAI